MSLATPINPARARAPGDWVALGACVGSDPNPFFPERGESPAYARAVCARCQVRLECLDYALDVREPFGVWGGLTAHERDRVLRLEPRRHPSRSQPAPHGTQLRYRHGCRCDGCREAASDYTRSLRKWPG